MAKVKFLVEFEGPILGQWFDDMAEAEDYAEKYAVGKPTVTAHVPLSLWKRAAKLLVEPMEKGR